MVWNCWHDYCGIPVASLVYFSNGEEMIQKRRSPHHPINRGNENRSNRIRFPICADNMANMFLFYSLSGYPPWLTTDEAGQPGLILGH